MHEAVCTASDERRSMDRDWPLEAWNDRDSMTAESDCMIAASGIGMSGLGGSGSEDDETRESLSPRGAPSSGSDAALAGVGVATCQRFGSTLSIAEPALGAGARMRAMMRSSTSSGAALPLPRAVDSEVQGEGGGDCTRVCF